MRCTSLFLATAINKGILELNRARVHVLGFRYFDTPVMASAEGVRSVSEWNCSMLCSLYQLVLRQAEDCIYDFEIKRKS